ncbi:MAG TPA: hypothetical protein VNT01_14250 [Symbiobacteriaceae bacterium]|nr:hypothetical protein [Symbiobacteriaceae bacterium]
MTLVTYMIIGAALWATVYTASLAAGLRRRGNRKGAFLAAALAAAVLLIPLGVQYVLISQ